IGDNRTETQLKQSLTNSDIVEGSQTYNGWDFQDVWNSGSICDYPQLRWQYTPNLNCVVFSIGDNQTSASVYSELSGTFNSELDPSSVNNTNFYLRFDNGSLVSGTTLLDNDNRTVRFIPHAPLLTDKDYQLVATNQILRVDSTPIIQDNQTLKFSTHKNLDASESGLIAFYRMDGNGNDVIGSNHLSIHGASLSTDRFGNSNQAYYFDGTDDYLVSTSNLGISGLTPRTLVYWQKANKTVYGATNDGSYPHIVNWGNFTNFNGFGTYASDSANQMMGYGHFADVDSGEPLTNHWEIWAVSYDNSTMKIYKNGSLKSRAEFSLDTTDSRLWIGSVMNNTGNFFQGSIDDVRIYNRVLTAQEIADLATEPDRGLSAFLPLNGDASEVVDNLSTTNLGTTATSNRLGQPNKAMLINSTSTSTNYIKIDDHPSLKPTAAISFGVWAYSEDWGNNCSDNRLISKTEGGSYALLCRATDTALIAEVYKSSGYHEVTYPASSLTAGWHHLLATFDGKYLKLYIDDKLVDTNDT
ncbi:MAG: LamG-like jellyroll fold domain-containing protein, partial [Deltaproteobacteria bacterium]